MKPRSIRTKTRASTSRMKGKYIMKAFMWMLLKVQYFLTHHALKPGSSLGLPPKFVPLRKTQLSPMHLVQSNGVPLMMAVGATIRPAKRNWSFSTLQLWVSKTWYTYLAWLGSTRGSFGRYQTMAWRLFQRDCPPLSLRWEPFQVSPFCCPSIATVSNAIGMRCNLLFKSVCARISKKCRCVLSTYLVIAKALIEDEHTKIWC